MRISNVMTICITCGACASSSLGQAIHINAESEIAQRTKPFKGSVSYERGVIPGFVNHSFENPLVPGNGVYWESPTELPGWVGVTSIPDTLNLHGSIWASQEGDQHIEFDNPGASIEQTLVGLTAGVRYTVVFGLVGNPDRERVYGVSLNISDSVGTIAFENYEVSSIGTTRETIVWEDMSLSFVGTGLDTTFRFTRTDTTPAGWGPDLDNVRLELTCIADMNSDGVLDFFDVSVFLTAFGNEELVADFTSDGVWDFFDVSAFLSAFSAGCP